MNVFRLFTKRSSDVAICNCALACNYKIRSVHSSQGEEEGEALAAVWVFNFKKFFPLAFN